MRNRNAGKGPRFTPAKPGCAFAASTTNVDIDHLIRTGRRPAELNAKARQGLPVGETGYVGSSQHAVCLAMTGRIAVLKERRWRRRR